jgi:hypothetical protein
MDTPEEADGETLRRKNALNIKGMWKEGWSSSKLAEKKKQHWWNDSGKPSTSRRDFEWETSGGKASRGYKTDSDDGVNEDAPAVRKPRPISEIKADVDAFIRRQQERCDAALEESEQ